ncbi:MAG: hypothetical protein ACJ72J_19355 [Nitrososphaeraceae archaeon]
MKSKKSDSSRKKNVMKGNKKTSMSKRHRDTVNGRTTKTRQQRVSKAKPSKRKQQQQELVIKRSSGRKENFDTNRMAQTVGRSGVPFLMARDVAKTVSNKMRLLILNSNKLKEERGVINQSLHNQKKKL